MDFTFHNGTNGSHPWVEFYPYTPSESASYAFMALFGISTVIHFVLMIPFRAAYFIPMVLGGICETFGYYGRAWSHHDITDIKSWSLQQMLILCAPPFIAATIYMVLSRFIRSFDAEHLSSIRPKWITVIFVINDVICFLTQLAGAGVQITGDPQVMNIGMKVVVVGLVFSLIIFCWFILIAVKFHRRLSKEPTGVLLQGEGLAWKRYMWALYVSCLAVMIRNLVRTIEFASSKGSPLQEKEVFIYIFDGFMMFAAMVALFTYHPGLLIKRARRTRYPQVAEGSDNHSGRGPLLGDKYGSRQ